jgi:hypothetical protein
MDIPSSNKACIRYENNLGKIANEDATLVSNSKIRAKENYTYIRHVRQRRM